MQTLKYIEICHRIQISEHGKFMNLMILDVVKVINVYKAYLLI